MTATNTDRPWGWTGTALAIVILATLTPQSGSSVGQDFFDPLVPQSIGQWRDVVLNVLLYLPFGLLLGISRVRGVHALLASVGVSLAIELMQFIVPGRDPIARDVVTNALGGMMGWGLARTDIGALVSRRLTWANGWLGIMRSPSHRVSARLSLGWSVVIALASNATCWLLSPALPPPLFFGVASTTIDRARAPIRIGSYGNGAAAFAGLIDEVRIYGSARTPAEIAADMSRAVVRDGPHSDLLAAYGFEFDVGPLVLDSSPNTRNGTTHHTSWVSAGRFDGAMSFDGETSQVAVPDAALDLRQGLTIEAWVFPSKPLNPDALIIADSGDNFFLRASSSATRFPLTGVKFSGAPRMVGPRRGLPLKQWTHMALTYDGRMLRLYIDGQPAREFAHWSTHHPERVTLDGIGLPFASMREPERLPEKLFSDFSLDVSLRCGLLQPEPAPVFLIAGIQSINALEILAAGSELRVRFPRRAQQLGLAPADYRVPGALSACASPGSQRVLIRGPLQRVRLYDADGVELRGTGPGLGSAWSLLLDSQLLPIWVVLVISCSYLAALVFPFGFWARATPSSGIGVVILLASVFLVPRVWGFQPAGWQELLAIGAGLCVGAVAARRRTTNRA
jgi:VanZ family protein